MYCVKYETSYNTRAIEVLDFFFKIVYGDCF
jgi:hypothetical protein